MEHRRHDCGAFLQRQRTVHLAQGLQFLQEMILHVRVHGGGSVLHDAGQALDGVAGPLA